MQKNYYNKKRDSYRLWGAVRQEAKGQRGGGKKSFDANRGQRGGGKATKLLVGSETAGGELLVLCSGASVVGVRMN